MVVWAAVMPQEAKWGGTMCGWVDEILVTLNFYCDSTFGALAGERLSLITGV
jgi:hypothetical protein